jgi:hypothetical protein
MYSFRRLALLIAFVLFAGLGFEATGLHAQAGSPDSTQTAPATAPAPQTSGALTVQARLRARREQRRATAIKDVYTHLYEAYVGMGYLRFHAGDSLQKVTGYSWDVGVTRYFNERLGVTVDGRGLYGTAYITPNAPTGSAIPHPAVSEYSAMIGPTYRFVLHPRYSVSGRILAGAAFGNFTGDLGPFKPGDVGLYSNGGGVAISASVPVEYNVSPGLGLRLGPEYILTNFGSSLQNNVGFSGGFVLRWGKQ